VRIWSSELTQLVARFRNQAHFPQDCPPNTAVDANHLVHRFCAKPVAAPKDFVPYVISHPADYQGFALVKACGISVYTDASDLKRLQDFNNGLRKKAILHAKLQPSHGKIMPTSSDGDSHHTWWEYEDVRPETIFSV